MDGGLLQNRPLDILKFSDQKLSHISSLNLKVYNMQELPFVLVLIRVLKFLQMVYMDIPRRKIVL